MTFEFPFELSIEDLTPEEFRELQDMLARVRSPINATLEPERPNVGLGNLGSFDAELVRLIARVPESAVVDLTVLGFLIKSTLEVVLAWIKSKEKRKLKVKVGQTTVEFSGDYSQAAVKRVISAVMDRLQEP
jgi:hypothetical protein